MRAGGPLRGTAWRTAGSSVTARSPTRPLAATPAPYALAPMEWSVLQGLAVFRWGAWVWMAAVLVISRQDLERPLLAVGLVALALAVTRHSQPAMP